MSLLFYTPNEDIPIKDSLNDYKIIFEEYSTYNPSLKEALEQMFKSTGISDQKAFEFANDIIIKVEKIIKYNFDLIKEKYPHLKIDEAKIIRLIPVIQKIQIIVLIKFLI